MANQTLKPFSGELDPIDSASGLKPFTGTLDGENPTDGPLARGWNKAKQSMSVTSQLATGNAAGAAQTIKQADDYARANPGMQEGKELGAAWERGDGISGGISEVAGEFAKDWREAPGAIKGLRATGRNLRALGEGIVEQVPNMVAPVTGMVGGALAGGAAGSAAPIVGNVAGAAVGGWVGASAGNTLVEGGGMAQEALQKAGINPQDTPAVERFIKERGDSILGKAAVKGSIIGAVDTLTAGLGGRLLNAPARAAADRALAGMGVNMADKAAVKAATQSPEFAAKIAGDATYQASKQGAGNIARNVGAAALDPAGEFAGEFVGQGVATGEWDTKNAALEAFSSIGQSGAMFAGQKAYQALTRPAGAAEAPAAPADAGAIIPPWTTEAGAADPNAPQAPIAQAPEAPDQNDPGAPLPTSDPVTPEQRIAAAEEKLSFVQQQAQANGWDKRLIGARDEAMAELDAIQLAPTPELDIKLGRTEVPIAGQLYAPGDTTNPLTGERIPDQRPLSQQMGIDPTAGALSKVAALAVDSGTSQHLQQAQALQEAEKVAQKQAPALSTQAQSATQNVAPPANLSEGLARIRAQRQEAANAQTATTPVAAATAPLPAARAPAVEAAGVVADGAPSIDPTTRRKAASWVIRDKATGVIVMETASKSVADKINTTKYEAVPIGQHLAGLNQPTPTPSTTGVTSEPQAPEAQQAISQQPQAGGQAIAGPAAAPAAGPSAAPGGSGVQAAGVGDKEIDAKTDAVMAAVDRLGNPGGITWELTRRLIAEKGLGVADNTIAILESAAKKKAKDQKLIEDLYAKRDTNPGAQGQAAPGAQAQAPTAQGPVARPDGWRKSMLRAGPVAKGLGIDHKGKRLAQIVAEIDAADAQRAGVRQDGADLSSGQIDRSQPGSTAQVMRSLAQQFRDRHAVTQQDTDRTFAGVLEQFANEVEEGKRTPQSVQQAIERYRELAAQPVPATHADPGEKAEAATSAVVTDSLKTAARNEDTKPSEMRKWLVAEIDRAMLDAPEKDATEFVSFDVPGDGVFKVQKSRERLLEFRKKVMASPGFKDGGQKQAKPQQNDSILNGGGTTETIRAFLADGDVQGAVEFAKLKGVEFTPVEPRASITANGKFKRVPASVKSSVPSVAEGLTQVEAEQINQYLTAEQARAEPADAQDADVQQSPQDFIPAPDGGLDYGEITPEMSKAMRRQAGKQEADEKQARADNRKEVKQGAGEAPPVTDFGEKLEGARKDMPPSLKEEVSDEKIASLPLSKIWPSDAHESIEDDAAAALVFAARQEIPAKPRVPSRVRAWVSKVKTYRTLVKDLGKNSLERIEQLSKEKGFHSLDPFFAKVRLLSQLPRETWSRVERVEEYPNAIRYEKDGSKTAVAFSSVTIDGKSRRFEGVGKIGPDEVQAVKEMLGTAPPKKDGLTAQDFEVRGTAKTGYKINRKGDSEYRSLKIFTGEDAAKKAIAWRDEHTAELEAAWEAVKARDNVSKAEVRRDENRERTGENRRNGRDVNAEMFTDAFGFRGGQFGNWVGQGADAKSRQGMLNDAYDALLDLSDILGIPSRAISLNGTLGLSFGARGSGKAAAHFEPSNLVINLTKTRGAGSLAHEWFHALDNYFSRMRGGEVAFTGDNNAYRQNNFVTYKPEAAWGKAPITPYTNFMRGGQLRERLQRLPGFTYDANKTLAENAKAAGFERDPNHKDGVRPQVEKAFADLVQALNESPMAKRASSLDKAADGYWGRIIERGARSFENYVISKMAQRGWSNDFLANIRSFDEWMAMGKNAERYPYLKPEEDAPVVAAFDKLFETVETRETEGGNVAMFSRAEGRSAPPADSNARNVATQMLVDGLKAKWTRAPEIIVARNMQDPQISQRVRDYDAQLKSQGSDGEARGFIYKGKVYLLSDQLKGPQQIAEVLFHEVLGHYGLRGAFGDALTPILNQVGLGRRKEVLAKAREYGMVKKGMSDADTWAAMSLQDRLSAAEEVLAEMAQSQPTIGFVQRAIAAIRNWLRTNVPGFNKLALTDADIIQAYILPARGFVTRSKETGAQSLERAMMAFSRTATDQTQTEAFNKWFGDSKVVDADGKPLVVYHGTTAEISAFQQNKAAEKDAGWYGRGIYFTADPDTASTYSRYEELQGKELSGAPRVMPVYVSIQNPYVWPANRRAATTPEEAAAIRKELEAAGHDGVIVPNEYADPRYAGHYEVVAFRPEQIKSATGNSGSFDPANADIRFSRTSTATGTQSAWDAPVQTGFDDVIYKLQDKNIDLKRVVESITKSAGQVADSVNAYLKEELFHKRAAKRVEDFGARELKPLMNQMRLMGLGMEDVEEYLHARHAKEANAVIAQRNPGEPGLQDGGSGMTDQAADNYFAKLDPAQRRKLEAVAKNVDAIIDKTRKLYVSYGLENQDVVDGWASMYQHYIPLMREDKDGGMGTGQGFSVKGKETKGRTGSTRKVVDILANIASQREKLIVRGEKNIVAQALVGLAQANPNPDFWEVRSQAPTERVFDAKSGVVVERPDPLFKSRDNVIVAKVLDSGGKVTEQMVVFNEDNPRALRMAAAMKNLDAGNLEGLLGVSAKITRYFSAINTQYNPVFGVVNLVRDVQGAMVNLAATPLAGQQGKIARDTLSALAGIYGDIRKTRKGGQATSKWAQLWEQMQDDGGTTGYRELFTTSADRANNLKSILNPEGWMDNKWGKFFTAGGKLKVPMSVAQKGATEIFGWLSDYNEAMENGVRLAAYKAALDMGMSREQAASLAKNLTVNFNRKGQVGMQAGAVYAFFNAAMQGTARIGQTLFDMDGGDISTLRLSKTGKAVVYGGVTLGVMQALALAGAGFDEEDPPEFVRERSLIIPTGGKTYVSIPMPLGLHVIPGIGRHATEFALSGFDKPAKRALSVIGMFADAFNPIGNAGLSMQTLAPTALDPLVALTENKDWTGKPIARVSFNKAIPGHTQWKDTATWYSKMAAEAINWASGGNEYVAGALSPTPDQIDYLIAQVGGGVAREASKVFQAASTTVNGEELPTYKIPLLGRFAGNAASQASQGTAFYANLDRLNALETEIKGLRKDGRFGEAAQLARENPQAIMIPMANRAERDVQKLRREKRELIATGANREEVRAKEAQITEVMARLNEAAARRKATAPE